MTNFQPANPTPNSWATMTTRTSTPKAPKSPTGRWPSKATPLSACSQSPPAKKSTSAKATLAKQPSPNPSPSEMTHRSTPMCHGCTRVSTVQWRKDTNTRLRYHLWQPSLNHPQLQSLGSHLILMIYVRYTDTCWCRDTGLQIMGS